jgi:hypothetical protein
LFACKLWLLIDYYCITKVIDDLIGKFEPDLFVCELSSAVKDSELYLVASIEKFADSVHFDVQVVLANFQAKTDLLHLERLRSFLVLLLLLCALVIELTPVDDLCYGRIRIGRNLNQVQTLLGGDTQCFLFTQDTKLLAGIVDYSQLLCLDGSIQAGEFGDRIISLRLHVYNVVILTDVLTEVNHYSWGAISERRN